MEITNETIIACICEGAAEKVIIQLLLENNELIFKEEHLLDSKILTGSFRQVTKFTQQYLTMDYGEQKPIVLCIQDNNTKFNLKKPYMDKIKGPYLIITSPEIEMLMIHSLGLYEEFQKVKSTIKPSDFTAKYLKKKSSVIKEKSYVKDFYQKYSLKEAILCHSRKGNKKDKKNLFLSELLK